MAKTQKTVTKDGYAIFRKTQKTVPEGRFRDNMNLHRVIIPSHIKEIRRCAFINCRNLEHVYFEDGDLACIQNYAFAGCESLRSMTVPEETLVLPFAFQGCIGLEQPIRSESGDAFYAYPQGWQLTQYTVPSGVNTIASTAFLENHALEEVILPESVDRLDDQAFYESGIKRN